MHRGGPPIFGPAMGHSGPPMRPGARAAIAARAAKAAPTAFPSRVNGGLTMIVEQPPLAAPSPIMVGRYCRTACGYSPTIRSYSGAWPSRHFVSSGLQVPRVGIVAAQARHIQARSQGAPPHSGRPVQIAIATYGQTKRYGRRVGWSPNRLLRKHNGKP
jgi:hypothetical protein